MNNPTIQSDKDAPKKELVGKRTYKGRGSLQKGRSGKVMNELVCAVYMEP